MEAEMHRLKTTALIGAGPRRLGVALVAALAAAALVLLPAAPARAAAGGCSVASAPTIQSGQTQASDPNACPDGRQYWAMNLRIGDTLNIDIAPSVPSGGGFGHYEFNIYGPDVGTIGNPLCGNAYASPSKLSCLIPAAGRWLLVTGGAGSFTPVTKRVHAKAGRVAGACDPANAPIAPSRVTQYVNSNLCQPSGNSQYWMVDLRRADILKVNILPFGGSIFVHLYGPNLGSLGNPLCGNGYSGPATLTCRIRRSGRYVLEARNAGSFTPLAIHPTHVFLTAPRFVKVGRAIAVSAVIHSNASHPTGICVIQEQSSARWVGVARVHTTTGACSARVVPSHHGTVRLRVRFIGAPGWASSTSKPVSVVVR
jgi:hypothetical protein